MALLWIEGFEGFGNTLGSPPSPVGIIAQKYPVLGDESRMDIEVGRTGLCLQLTDHRDYIQSPYLTNDDTLIVGDAIKVNTLPSAFSFCLISFFDGTTQGVSLWLNSDGTLSIYRGGTLLGTSTNTLTVSTWFYIELKVVTHATNGSFEVRVNESNWLSDSGINTKEGSNDYHNAFRLCTPQNIYTYHDDVYALDSTGTVNNDFLGVRKVEVLRPEAIGDSSQWTPSAGDNYETVDEEVLDGDVTYVETDVSTDKDLYGYEDLSNLSSIDGIQIVTEARMVLGQMDLHPVIKSGSTESDGDAHSLVSTSYTTHSRIAELNPHTSNKWSPSEVDNAQFGIKVV